MPLESATYIDQLVPANPVHGDNVNQGDAHLRLIKSVLQNTFPNFTAAALASTNAAIDAVVAAFYTSGSSLVSLATSIVTLAASLRVTGGLAYAGPLTGPAPVTVSTSTYTVGAADEILQVTADTTLTLPSASADSGRRLWITMGSSSLTVSTAGTDVVPLSKSAAVTGLFLGVGDTQGPSRLWGLLVSNGTDWVQVAGDTLTF